MSATSPSVTVVVEEKAFMSILISAIESFPTKYFPGNHHRPAGAPREGEVSGLLFGQRILKRPDIAIMNVAIALPSTMFEKRTSGSITKSLHHEDRIIDVLSMFPSYEFLGGYHSHPCRSDDFDKKTSVTPSTDDDEVATYKASEYHIDLLEIVIGLTCQERRSKVSPSYVMDNIIHNCCGKYKYSLAAYCTQYVDEEARTLVGVDSLVCQAAAGINNADLS